MQTTAPAPATALAALCDGALIVHVNAAKRQLAWRPRRPHRQKGRLP
jgi:hypothetical protein